MYTIKEINGEFKVVEIEKRLLFHNIKEAEEYLEFLKERRINDKI